MKTIKIELSKEIKRLEIVPLADFHVGDPECKYEEIEKIIQYIKDNEDTYCILNGDLMNTALKTSVSDVYSEVLTPMEQLLKVRDLLVPIASKIICVTGGNHERRIWKTDGIDVTALLAKELGVLDRYAPNSAVVFIKFGLKKKQHGRKEQQMLYTIFCNHGTGNGKRIGGKLNRLEDVAAIVDADVYLHGHSHLPAVFKQNFFRTNLTWCSLEQVEKLFVNNNAFLDYGGYGEVFEFAPASRSVPKIILSGTERAMKAIL